jgi:hypothetical protein
MLSLRRVEKICWSELTLPARLGRQDKSNGAMGRLSHCLHIQDLSPLICGEEPKYVKGFDRLGRKTASEPKVSEDSVSQESFATKLSRNVLVQLSSQARLRI